MGKDQLAKWCSGCGQLEQWNFKENRSSLRFKVKVPKFENSFGKVPAWYAYACSPECKAEIIKGIAEDRAAAIRLGAIQ